MRRKFTVHITMSDEEIDALSGEDTWPVVSLGFDMAEAIIEARKHGMTTFFLTPSRDHETGEPLNVA